MSKFNRKTDLFEVNVRITCRLTEKKLFYLIEQENRQENQRNYGSTTMIYNYPIYKKHWRGVSDLKPSSPEAIVCRLKKAVMRKKRTARNAAARKPQAIAATNTPLSQPTITGIHPFAAFQFIESGLLANMERELTQHLSESEITQQLIAKKDCLKRLGASDAQITEFDKAFVELRARMPENPAYRIHQKYNGGGG